ncbi:encapsulin [Arthrobacter sp. H14-L1]|nr:encapsulin [Arthrobacter sp. H14-L1]
MDLLSLDEACLRIARAENVTVFHGWDDAGLTGITGATPHPPFPCVEDWAVSSRVSNIVVELFGEGFSWCEESQDGARTVVEFVRDGV